MIPKLAQALMRRSESLFALLERWKDLPPLLVRLFVGYFFFETGLGKAQDLATFTARFTEWGIPAPAFNAALSAYTELIGGALILLGLATRVVCIPMFINMAVAVATVKIKSVSGLDDFVELDEPLYALFFLWLGFNGPGRVSLDHLLVRWWKRRAPEGAISSLPIQEDR